MTDVTLIPATLEHLQAYQQDKQTFATLVGGEIPDGWPEFPEAIGFTADKLREHPDEAHWWMHFFVNDGTFVGSGGFTGPPQDRTVEIGYEIAPAFRGRGLATAAAQAMIDKALATGEVDSVIAHTLAQDNPSTGVLRKLGFSQEATVTDPEEGDVWRWRLVPA